MFHLFVWLAGCGESGRGGPGPGPGGTDGPTDPPEVVGFERVTPDEVRPTIDAGSLDCAGGEAALGVEIAGRAASAEAVLVGPREVARIALAEVALPEGSLWQRFEGRAPFAGTCGRAEAASLVVARDADGAVVDCVAGGADARRLVAGELDDRLDGALGDVDLARCRVR